MRTCYHRLFMAAVTIGPELLGEDLCLPVVCVNAAKDGRKWVVDIVGNVFGPNTAASPWRLSRDIHQSTVIFYSRGSSKSHPLIKHSQLLFPGGKASKVSVCCAVVYQYSLGCLKQIQSLFMNYACVCVCVREIPGQDCDQMINEMHTQANHVAIKRVLTRTVSRWDICTVCPLSVWDQNKLEWRRLRCQWYRLIPAQRYWATACLYLIPRPLWKHPSPPSSSIWWPPAPSVL